MTPYISVIIPLYNKENNISNTLSKVLNQTFSNFEVIIVNDGSTDKSLEIVKRFEDKRIKIFNTINKGAGAARNYGISLANSNYIALLDADDVWFPNHLEEHVKSINLYPNADLFCNAYGVVLIGEKILKAKYNLPNTEEPIIVNDYFEASTIFSLGCSSSIVFKKIKFYKVNCYDETIKSGQDIDLLIRLGLDSRVVYNPSLTSYYDKRVIGSLSKENHQESKLQLFTKYIKLEKENLTLKKFLNLNRYSLAIQCKLNRNTNTLKRLLPYIDKSLLNKKQRLILETPIGLIVLVKKIHLMLIKKGIYISSFN